MNTELENLIAIIKNNLGKDISVYDQSFLMRTLDKRKAEIGIDNTADYCSILKKNVVEEEALIGSLSIQYTDFFRESLTYALLEKVVLPGVINGAKKGQEIRIWSAGCSYGQEPYSLAILLNEQVATSKKEIRFRIFATDISHKALVTGHAGTYHGDALNNVRLNQLDKYFVKQGDTYTVIPFLRQHVDFSFYDLLDQWTNNPPDSIYGDFDIVMCSNLLFYYNQESQKIIINKLQNALSSGGYLITGETEKNCVERISKLKALTLTGPIFSKQKNVPFRYFEEE